MKWVDISAANTETQGSCCCNQHDRESISSVCFALKAAINFLVILKAAYSIMYR